MEAILVRHRFKNEGRRSDNRNLYNGLHICENIKYNFWKNKKIITAWMFFICFYTLVYSAGSIMI